MDMKQNRGKNFPQTCQGHDVMKRLKTGVLLTAALSAVLITGSRLAAAETVSNAGAAGDVTESSVVLWARSNVIGRAKFKVVARDRGGAPSRVEHATVLDPLLPVKVKISGLNPATEYEYSISIRDSDIAEGRFTTAASAGVSRGLRFGVSGDWRGELAPFPAVKNAAQRGLDFFMALGDTIYADIPSPDVPIPQATTVAEFRAKHNEVYSPRFGLKTLGDLRASTAIFATIDDHEVTNDFAGGAPPSSDSRFAQYPDPLINETELYRNGVQVFHEYNPISDEFYGTTGDPRTSEKPKLYRYRTFGSDAAIFVLDARSYRDRELTPANPLVVSDVVRFIVQSFDPARTMLGAKQIEDLENDLLAAQNTGVAWKFIMMPEPIQNLGVVFAQDRYEGYASERNALLRFIKDHDIRNVVFVSADFHGTLVNNLKYQEFPFGPQIGTDAFEIVTGAVAFDAPFGPTVVNLAAQLGLLTPAEVGFYNSLPVRNDGDDIPNDKDDFLKLLVNRQVASLGYDSLGLNGSTIPARLEVGDYIAVHTYGWTEFQIDQATSGLRVTTYGIQSYTRAEMEADPQSITSREPAVVSQFSVDAR
jgi:phosphodiesterase/alkaline phosphatase D-like protein